MKHILLAEDTAFFGRLIQKKLAQIPDIQVHWVETREDARELLYRSEIDFDIAISGYDLPDAANGEMLDDLKTLGISTIVFTGSVNEQVRERVWALGVVDYLLKEDAQNLELLADTVQRLQTNDHIGILVVDDSAFPRETLARLLRVHRYTVYEAANGKEAFDQLSKHPEIRLVITDFNMPEMDGFELTQAIRKKYSKDELAIIGISAQGKGVMAARFLKSGANDFIIKQSFLTEEFYGRVTQILDNQKNMALIRKTATTDSLTGLANRREFIQQGRRALKKAAAGGEPLCCAMLDLDHFKTINDRYGHETGDLALQLTARLLLSQLTADTLVARIGGEEFAVLWHAEATTVYTQMEQFRQTLATTALTVSNDEPLHFTTSIGIAQAGAEDSLESLLRISDQRLYRAKDEGRNRVIAN